MVTRLYQPSIFIILVCLLAGGCGSSPEISPDYLYTEPDYHRTGLTLTSDTICFNLHDSAGNRLLSSNVFLDGGQIYISFLDKRSKSISIYDFNSGTLIKRIVLEDLFFDHDIYQPTAYVRGFDSIFVVNRDRLFVFDSTGKIKRSVGFIDGHSVAWAFLGNGNPLVEKENKFYLAVRPDFKERDLREIKGWRIFYQFDLNSRKTTLYYSFPKKFRNDTYGLRMLTSSYCYNGKGKFVISFVGDTNIYETDLKRYHHSYYGKSCFQKFDIYPVSEKELLDRSAYEKYITRDSYGPIYFDASNMRYLRVARQALTEDDYDAYRWNKPQSLIIFDRDFKIIGESKFADGINLNQLLMLPDGKIYARIKEDDRGSIYFVRLVYYNPLSA